MSQTSAWTKGSSRWYANELHGHKLKNWDTLAPRVELGRPERLTFPYALSFSEPLLNLQACGDFMPLLLLHSRGQEPNF